MDAQIPPMLMCWKGHDSGYRSLGIGKGKWSRWSFFFFSSGLFFSFGVLYNRVMRTNMAWHVLGVFYFYIPLDEIPWL